LLTFIQSTRPGTSPLTASGANLPLLALSITGVVLVAGVLSYVLLISQRVEMTETIPAQ